MITELDIGCVAAYKEGQIIGQGMADKQFQLEEFKTFLDLTRGLPDSIQQLLAKDILNFWDILNGGIK